MQSEPEEFPERDAFKKAAGFPEPSPERDARVKGAIRAKLQEERLRAVSRRWVIGRWVSMAAAAALLVGLSTLAWRQGKDMDRLETVTVRPAPQVEERIGFGEYAPEAGDAPPALNASPPLELKQMYAEVALEEAEKGNPRIPINHVASLRSDTVFSLGFNGPVGPVDHRFIDSLQIVDEYTKQGQGWSTTLDLSGVDREKFNREFQGIIRGDANFEPIAKLTEGLHNAPLPGTWKRSQLVPNASRILVGDKEELPLKGFQANVRVDGFRARVLIDLYFLNDRDRRLEGSFSLRLPDGASPYFFAFGETTYAAPDIASAAFLYSIEASSKMALDPDDILVDRASTWSAVREARMVPKEKAALAYRETVRRVVDPALLEWSGAGVFSARVFPLPPGKLERVVIGYDLDLLPAGDDLEMRLDLPQGIPGATVDVNVADLEGVEVETTPKADPAHEGGRSIRRFLDPTDRFVTVRLGSPGPLLLSGDDPKTGPYFAARLRPEIPGGAASAPSPRAVFLVDTSLSSNPEKFNVWLKLLGAILEKNRDTMKEFAVLFFGIDAAWWREAFVPNTPEAAKALLDDAGKLALEGATDLGAAIREAIRPAWAAKPLAGPAPDLFLLSDGSATWGESDVQVLAAVLRGGPAGSAGAPPAGALFAYATGLGGTDLAALGLLARGSGGALFAVTGESGVEKAAAAHRARPWRIAGISVEGGTDLLVAGRPESLFPGQEIVLAGRGAPKPGAEVALTLRRGEEEKVVRAKLVRAVTGSELAPRTYGQIATGQLEEIAQTTEALSKSYATHFRVTGRTCSLLMLESEEDYRRYDIKPEEDAFVVKSSPASAAVEKALKEAGATLGDPKASFLAWLKRLESMPGFNLKIETALHLAIEEMPRSAFEVAPARLIAKVRTWEGVPGALQEALASGNLDYDAIAAEAAHRLGERGDSAIARDVAFSALGWGLGGQAYGLLRRVALARPWEPGTYRAMAACLEEIGDADLAIAYYEVALAGKWDARFGEFRRILGLDYVRLLRRIERKEAATSVPDFARARLETLGTEFDPGPADLIVAISWSTDGTDVDLHVVEPSGEECFYGNKETKSGGRITRDVTGGYGPEMYLLKSAPPGKYKILAHYYAADRNRASARSKVYATVIEGWGTPREKVTRKTVALMEGKGTHEIAEVGVEK
jgi:hypothetical protein